MEEPQASNGSEHHGERVLITGGTGFVGSAVRRALADRPLRLLVRSTSSLPDLSSNTEVVRGDVTDRASLQNAADGCSAIIHLVAIIEERGGMTFDRVIREGTENVLEEARRAGVRRFVLMSALGARDDSRYAYLQAKWRAERAVQESGLAYTIIRPSVIYGPGDGFINVLARVVKQFPVVPVVGSGDSKFQPLSVADVAAIFARAVDDPSTEGRIFELGGTRIYTYEQLIDLIAAEVGKRKPKVHIPVTLMVPAVKLSQPLPRALRPPVTVEQLRMLALDNCTDNSATERLLGRRPLALKDGIGYVNQ